MYRRQLKRRMRDDPKRAVPVNHLPRQGMYALRPHYWKNGRRSYSQRIWRHSRIYIMSYPSLPMKKETTRNGGPRELITTLIRQLNLRKNLIWRRWNALVVRQRWWLLRTTQTSSHLRILLNQFTLNNPQKKITAQRSQQKSPTPSRPTRRNLRLFKTYWNERSSKKRNFTKTTAGPPTRCSLPVATKKWSVVSTNCRRLNLDPVMCSPCTPLFTQGAFSDSNLLIFMFRRKKSVKISSKTGSLNISKRWFITSRNGLSLLNLRGASNSQLL